MSIKRKTSLATLAIAGAVSAGGFILPQTSTFAAGPQAMEKCYGIARAGMNDCHTATTSCAGSANDDAQPDAWIYVPKGTCKKIVGATTTPAETSSDSDPS